MTVFYDMFQLVAYNVPTDQVLGAGGECVPLMDLKAVANELKVLSKDAYLRLMRMLAVVEKAMSAADLSDKDRDNTLKIFMAPEFYFRPEQGEKGSQRSYTEAEKKALVAVLKYVFSQDAFKHWLFVLGTIAWNQPASSILGGGVKEKLVADDSLAAIANEAVVWNTVLIARGGDKQDTVRTFNKVNYAAEVDSVAYGNQPMNPEDSEQTAFHKLGKQNQTTLKDHFEQQRKLSEGDFFLKFGTNNLWFGVEICLDHLVRTLGKTFYNFARTSKVKTLDLQLLTACGMRVVPANLKVAEGQFVVRMDGASKVAGNWPGPFHFSEIQQFLGKPKVNIKGQMKQVGPCATTAYLSVQDYDQSAAWEKFNKRKTVVLESPLAMDVSNLKGRFYKEPNNAATEQTPDLKGWCQQALIIYEPQSFIPGVQAPNAH